MTDAAAAWSPQVLPGGGFDPRAMADRLWDQGMYDEANNLGRMVPDIPGRVCRLTGTQAHGYARIPGTDGKADVAISHGAYEQVPTALQRWVGGWTDPSGTVRDPQREHGKVVRQGGKLMLPLMHADHGAAQGLEGMARALGLDRPGARVRVEYSREGVVELHRADVAGPRPAAD